MSNAKTMTIERLEVPIAKAEYLLSNTADAGKGGDKRKFWRVLLGFDNPELVREAIMAQVVPACSKRYSLMPTVSATKLLFLSRVHLVEFDRLKQFGSYYLEKRLLALSPQFLRDGRKSHEPVSTV